MPPDFSSFPVPVSRETGERLAAYHALLLKWQKTVNLVGPGTVDTAWTRHFADSAQIAPLLPPGGGVLFDLGSGAGFPGLVIAILCPEWRVHLVESDERKAAFLSAVSRETGAGVTVHNRRIESLPSAPAPDVVTARALAGLDRILAWCAPWAAVNPDMQLLLPKGERAAEEIAAAQAHFHFVLEPYPSVTAPEARILRLSGVVRR